LNIPKKKHPHRDPSTPLPRISSGTCWRRCSSCAFLTRNQSPNCFGLGRSVPASPGLTHLDMPTQDCVLGYFQSSLRDSHATVSYIYGSATPVRDSMERRMSSRKPINFTGNRGYGAPLGSWRGKIPNTNRSSHSLLAVGKSVPRDDNLAGTAKVVSPTELSYPSAAEWRDLLWFYSVAAGAVKVWRWTLASTSGTVPSFTATCDSWP
jgi:hypothetical protein